MSRPVNAIFLDRDGVLNRAIVREGKSYPPARVEDVEFLPGVREALVSLKDPGFVLIVVTNQPDVARGTTSREAVEGINASLRVTLPDRSISSSASTTTTTAAIAGSPGRECCWPGPPIDIDLAAATWSATAGATSRQARRGCRTVFIDRAYREPPPIL